MFNRLAAIRIKAAEEALEAGRLEEAHDIVAGPNFAGQGRVDRLMERLLAAFLERGQERLLNRQFSDALADFDRAARCGGSARLVEEWRDRARRAMQDDQKMQGQVQMALAEARQKVAAGSIAGAADALAKSPVHDADGAAMGDEINRQRLRAEAALTAARDDLKDGHFAEAAKHLATARQSHAKLDGIADVEVTLVELVLTQARASFGEGRLDRARYEIMAIGDLGKARPERIEMDEALRLAQEAAEAVRGDRYAKARMLLGRLGQMGVTGRWIEEAREQLDRLEEQRRAVLEGPLGLLLGRDMPSGIDAQSVMDVTLPSPVRASPAPPVVNVRQNGYGDHDGALPRRMLLRIDGVGSFLLLRGDRISIGRGGPGASADLQLVSDLSERHAEIVRAGEDYFVTSLAGVELAGRAVEHALLQDGDRIRFGPRVRMKFQRPSLKSPAAVLELGEGVRTAGDCRRVILWSGPLLLGGTRECHVPMRGSGSNVVMMERGGQIVLRQMGPGGTGVAVALGALTEFGEIRMSVQEAAKGSGFGKVVG